MNNKNFIGFLDSGFGGISVLKETISLIPNEKYIYLADSINAPYGTRNKEEILNLSINCIKKLLNYNVKVIVIACNTISVNCYDKLKNIFNNIKLIKTIPSFLPILQPNTIINDTNLSINFKSKNIFELKSNKKSVLFLSTKATLNSSFVINEIKNYKKIFKITKKAPKDFVTYVENMQINTKECEEYTKKIIDKNYDYIILGCTHFPFMKSIIEKFTNKNTIFIDNGKITAKNCYEYLKEKNIINNDNLEIKILDTNINDKRKETYKELLGINNISFL